ncbi:SDR family NAD(P)-dependent oxidoreductase [Candidatus Micrarchaeota archaeon]|nr:SDR family NAD(P)-dependent oxidoreductase [Candidatus Micrarchaeota archaeon]
MDWKSKKVLVTGAGGFIGSHLCEELVSLGADVRAMIHYNSSNYWGNLELVDKKTVDKMEVIAGDVRDPFFMRKAVKECDYVFHLAALIAIPYSYIAPKDFVDTNVNGTLNVMQASLEEGVKKIVHTSTSEVYGTAQYVPIDESHPLQGQSPYSASKIGADKIAESYYLSFGLPIATLRPFNTFGPRQSARAVIPTIISQLFSERGGKAGGAEGKLNLGSLIPVRDFTYVKDTAKAFVAVAESSKTVGIVVNSGTGEGHTIGDIANSLISITKSKAEIVKDNKRIRPEKSEVMKLICSNKKIKELTGWKPQVSFEQGLGETVDYIKNNIGRYKTDIYNL